jgi:hypothetical protein
MPKPRGFRRRESGSLEPVGGVGCVADADFGCDHGAQQLFWGPALGFAVSSTSKPGGARRPVPAVAAPRPGRRTAAEMIRCNSFRYLGSGHEKALHRGQWGVCKRLRIGSAWPQVTPQDIAGRAGA